MDVTTKFTSNYVNSAVNLSWVLLTDWTLTLIAAIGILFYFNRFLAVIVSRLFEWFLWKNHKIKIKVQSVKISFLGGRIFFKNLSIITKNEIILMHQGWLTWRYWLTFVRKSDFSLGPSSKIRIENENLPCRFALEIFGLEYFMYNRVQAFDLLNEQLGCKVGKSNGEDPTTQQEKCNLSESTDKQETDSLDSLKIDSEVLDRSFSFFSIFKALPMSISVEKGAIVVGNENTPSLLVTSYSKLTGLIDLSTSKSAFDYYKLSFKVRAHDLQTSYKPNLTYKNALDLTNLMNDQLYKKINKLKRLFKFLKTSFQNFNKDKKPQEEVVEVWHGLKRYLLDDSPDTPTVEKVEYAKYTNILDTEYVDLHYYYDITGRVPKDQLPPEDPDSPDVGNGGCAPETGLDFVLSKSTIYYGPWADKERFHTYKLLFLAMCRDASPFERLVPGVDRVYTAFKISIETVNETIIRIPTKERSKDPLYYSRKGEGNSDNLNRPFGWIELKLDSGSTVMINNSYIPTIDHGWRNQLFTNFISPELRSSVNHDIFFKADRHTLDADIGYPLKWNGLATWQFNNCSYNPHLYILREHITLAIDLFDDFSSGDPTPYKLFRPFNYIIQWKFVNYGIYLNINERNIINNPTDFNDNTYMSFQGEDLSLDVQIPLDTIFRKSNTVDFKVNTDYFDLVLLSPPWSTKNNFMKYQDIGRANNFVVEGSYTYYAAIEIDSVDTMIVNCNCDDTTLLTYGFVARYILLIKENYFGDHIHFKTLSEFMDELNSEGDTSDSESSIDSMSEDSKMNNVHDLNETDHQQNKDIDYRVVNETDVFFSFCVNNGCIVLPSHIYDAESHLALHFQTLDIDIRFTNYYMDMQANFSSINCRAVYDCDERKIFGVTNESPQFDPDLFIDGLSVHGHRVFGLPPVEPTYFCKWDFAAGEIAVTSDGKFIDALERSVKNAGFTYMDLENQLGIPEDPVYDIVNLMFVTPSVVVELTTEEEVLNLTLTDFSLRLTDQANSRYSSRINADIENISLSSYKKVNPDCKTLSMNTSLKMTDFVQKRDFDHMRDLQETHVRIHDGPFHRCPFLISEINRSKDGGKYSRDYGNIKPSISIPDIAPPLNKQTVEFVFQDLPDSLLYDSESASEESSLSDLSYSSRLDMNALSAAPADPRVQKRGKFDDDYFYSDNEYSPNYVPSPDTEYDSIILTFSNIQGVVSPVVLKVFESLARDTDNFTITNVLDALNIDVMTYLSGFTKSLSTVVNIIAVCPLIDIIGSDISTESMENFGFQEAKRCDHSRLRIESTNLTMSKKMMNTYDKQYKKLTVEDETKLAFKFENLALGFYQGLEKDSNQNKCSLQLSFDGFEFCFSDIDSLLVILNQEHMKLLVEPRDLDWVFNYIERLSVILVDTMKAFEKISMDRHKSNVELLHELTAASHIYQINHDPSCITKPSYVTRCAKEGVHIRLRDSWKVSTRLRHIVANLPATYLEKTNKRFCSADWQAPPNYKDEIMKVFSTWRIWEFSDIAKSYIFKYAFDELQLKESKVDIPIDFKLSISNFNIDIAPSVTDSDYFVIDNLYTAFTTDLRKVFDNMSMIESLAEAGEEVSELISVFANVSSIKSKVGVNTLSLKDSVSKFSQLSYNRSPNTGNTVEVKPETVPVTTGIMKKAKFISLNLVVHDYVYTVGLKDTWVSIKGKETVIVVNGLNCNQTFPFMFSSSNESTVIDLYSVNDLIFSHALNDTSIDVINKGDLVNGDKLVTVGTGSVLILLDRDSTSYVKAVNAFTNNDYPIIQSLIRENNKTENSATALPQEIKQPFNPVDIFSKVFGTITGTIHTHRLDIRLNLLSPIRTSHFINDLSFAFDVSQESMSFNVGAGKVNNVVGSYRKHSSPFEYFHHNLEKSKIDLEITKSADFLVVDTNMSVESIRTNILHITDSIRMAYTDKKIIEEHISMYVDSLKRLQSRVAEDTVDTVTPTKTDAESNDFRVSDLLEYCRFTLNASVQSLGVLVIQDHALVSLEIENSDLNVSLYDDTLKMNKPYGGISMPSIKIIYSVVGAHSNKFTMLDSNFELNVLNPQNKDYELQNLDVLTTHFRVILNPYITEELLTVYFKINRAVTKYGKPIQSLPLVATNSSASPTPIENILSFFSIRVTANRFCIGWLWESYTETYNQKVEFPGIIIGFEESRMLLTRSEGEIAVNKAFLANAQGTNGSNFYFSRKEPESANNRAYFPGFLLNYDVINTEEGTRITSKLRGQKVDFKVRTDSFTMAESLLVSVNRVQDAWKRYEFPETTRKSSVGSPFTSTFANNESSLEGIPKYLKTVDCVFEFDGGQMMLINDHLEIKGDVPSLSLQTPMIKISSSYSRSVGPIGHRFKVDVLTSESDNTLLSTCVPVIVEMIRSGRRLMKETEGNKKGVQIVIETPVQDTVKFHGETTQNFEFDRIFEHISVDFLLRIEPQRLSLSCEPTAKVETVVATSGITITFKTDSHVMAGSVHIQDLKAELQHVYSRQTSGSITVSDALIDFQWKKVDLSKREFTGVAKITSVDSFVNVQQRQDLDLFRDIWLPGEFYENSVVAKPTNNHVVDKTFAAKIREVSSTTAFPWLLKFIVTKVVCRLDIGKSLGVLIARIDDFSLISKKLLNWDQSAEVLFSRISIYSEGRLGGMIIVNKLNLKSYISWKDSNDKVLSIPLVNFSAGLDRLQTRIILDYHPFFLAEIVDTSFGISNKRFENALDKLEVTAYTKSCNVYFTALTAANFVDIYTTALRIRQDIKLSYRDVLHDSSPQSLPPILSSNKNVNVTEVFLGAIEKLHTNFSVELGSLKIHVAPSSLLDTQVMVIKLDSAMAQFSQNGSTEIEDNLLLRLDHLVVSLSSLKTIPTEESLQGDSVSEYIKITDSASGGNIFVFPSVNVAMDVLQENNTNVIQYNYSCTFGGKVDVRWKLGSVYFIREMWYSHTNSLSTRLTALRITSIEMETEEMNRKNNKSIFETPNIEDRLKDVEYDEKFQYIPMTEPVIETPQLRDLGNATPPLEWFGLHRNKFPNLTHKILILGFQKMVKEAEVRYAKVLK